MKSGRHQKSLSTRNLYLGSSHYYSKSSNCDPFSNMKLAERNIPTLRPICHRRKISENYTSQILSYESPRNIELKVSANNSDVLSQKFSVKSFLYLNPNFKDNNNKRFSKLPGLITPRTVIKNCDSGSMHPSRPYCETSKNIIKKVNDRFNLLIIGPDKKAENPNLDFSFGKTSN